MNKRKDHPCIIKLSGNVLNIYNEKGDRIMSMDPYFDDDKEIIKPISFLEEDEEYKRKPIGFMEKEINGKKAYAITSKTANGKYMRGNMLFFSLNGVEIYTDPNNIIFVDETNKTLVIRENSRIVNSINVSDPEQKQYIILYSYLSEDEEFDFRWEALQGRSAAYESIKANAPVINIEKSLVLVDGVKVGEALNVREFCDYLKNSNIYDDETFDIHDYDSEYL